MTIEELLKQESERLKDNGYVHGDREVDIFLSKLLKADSGTLINRCEDNIDDGTVETLQDMVNRRIQGEPVAYIVGTQSFFGWEFNSDNRALIPRPETETLTEILIRLINKKGLQEGKFLEVGTGAGIIAIALKKHFNSADITATDISDEALSLAEENARKLKVEVNFLESDLFSNVRDTDYDLIVANLPYVPTQKLEFVSDQILDWEPMVAIEAGEDGLKYIDPFIKKIGKHLKKSGIVALEFWHTHGEPVEELVKQYLPDHKVEIEKDLAGFDRYAIITPEN